VNCVGSNNAGINQSSTSYIDNIKIVDLVLLIRDPWRICKYRCLKVRLLLRLLVERGRQDLIGELVPLASILLCVPTRFTPAFGDVMIDLIAQLKEGEGLAKDVDRLRLLSSQLTKSQ
jgi:hypothetical protein